MRKYNSKTKRTIIIILLIFVVFIVIFSLFLKRYTEVKKTAYTVSAGLILFDSEQNKITTKSDGTIKVKWGGDYYLTYEKKNYNLSKHAVVYNSNTGDIALYGKFYEVNKNGKVSVKKNETKVKSSVISKFYKLEDRKYLIVDRTIEAVNSSLVTSNYLIVNLDKSGNATLINDKVSLKTITPTKLRTSAYTFDIANELLNFGGDDIKLKKIIGSTNKYDEDTYDLNSDSTKTTDGSNSSKSNGKGNGTGSGSGTGGNGKGAGGNGTGTGDGTGTGGNGSGIGGSGSGGGSGAGGNGNGTGGNGASGGHQGSNTNSNGTTKDNNSDYNNNYDSGISDETVDKIIKATKNTSVIRVNSNINSISVDYVVYDPDNEYKSVYVEVENTSTNQVSTIYLSKTDTNILIDNLTPNVYYNLTFKYSYKENSQTKEYTFDNFGIHTVIPSIYLTATKVVDNKVYYKITLDNKYNILGGAVNLLVNGQITKSASIAPKGTTAQISGSDCYFDLSDLKLNKKNNNVITLKLISLSFNTYTINPGTTYKFKY